MSIEYKVHQSIGETVFFAEDMDERYRTIAELHIPHDQMFKIHQELVGRFNYLPYDQKTALIDQMREMVQQWDSYEELRKKAGLEA